MNDFTHRAALETFDLNYDVTLLAPGSKKPWRTGWNKMRLEREELDFYLRRYRLNYGVLLGSRAGADEAVCVLDKDARSKEVTTLFGEHGIKSPLEVLTKKGVHVYMKTAMTNVKTKIKALGLPLDVKMTGCVVGRGSFIAETGWTYRLKAGKKMVAKDDLPELPASFVNILDVKMATETTMTTPMAMTDATVNRVRTYVAFIKARCHHGAHGQAYRCACKIADVIADFGLAMQVYREWNAANAVAEDGTTPYPFSEAELSHKMEDAFSRPRRA